jgi:flagellin-like hook-associated protein FlgL
MVMDEKKQVLKIDMGAEGTKTIKASFPSNSKTVKVKTEISTETNTEPKKLNKVVKGGVTQKKKPLGKRFMETFISDDVANVKSYIVNDVLIPAAKDTVSDIVGGIVDAIKSGVEVALFGEVRSISRSRRDSGRSYVSYDKYSSKDRDRRDERRELSHRDRARHNFDDIVFESRDDALDVRNNLVDLIDQYGEATVANLYDLVGITESFTDTKYGWKNLASSSVSKIGRDGYVLNLPKPILLD